MDENEIIASVNSITHQNESQYNSASSSPSDAASVSSNIELAELQSKPQAAVYKEAYLFAIPCSDLFDKFGVPLIKYTKKLLAKFAEYNPHCLPLITNRTLRYEISASPYFMCYARCKFALCKKYKFTIDEIAGLDELICMVEETAGPINHTGSPTPTRKRTVLKIGTNKVTHSISFVNPSCEPHVLIAEPASQEPVYKKRRMEAAGIYTNVHSFQVDRCTMFHESGQLLPDWLPTIRQGFEHYNTDCRLAIINRMLRYPKPRVTLFTVYGKCKYPNCKKFRFCIRDTQGSPQLTCHLGETLGEINHAVCEASKQSVPNMLQLTVMPANMADPTNTSSGGGDQIAALYRLKQSLVEQDQQSHLLKGFIQDIGYDPFHVILMCEEQHRVYCQQGNDSNLVLFLDALPCVLHAIDRQPKRPLIYYSVVAKTAHSFLPVASYISESRDCLDMFGFFNRLMGRPFAKDHRYFQPNIINTDASISVLQTCLIAFCCGTVESYLEDLWDKYVLDNDVVVGTVIHWCSSHLMNRVKRYLKTYCKNTDTSVIISLMSLLISSNEYQFQENIISTMLVICCSKHTGEIFRKNLLKYQTLVEEHHAPSIKAFAGRLVSYIEEETTYTEYASNSPFGKRFNTMNKVTIDLLKAHDNPNLLPTNQFYNPKFITYFLNHLAPFLPLWTANGIVDCPILTDTEKHVLSNSVVHNHFDNLQQDIFKNNKKQHCAEVIESLYEYHHSLATTHLQYQSQST